MGSRTLGAGCQAGRMTDRPPRGAGDPADEQGQPGAPGAPVEDEDPDIAWDRAIEEARARGDRFLPPAPKIPGEPEMIFLNVRPWDGSEPEGLPQEARARRRLADRLAQTLTDPPCGRVGHIEALVHEIRLNNQGEVIPVFKIPGAARRHHHRQRRPGHEHHRFAQWCGRWTSSPPTRNALIS